jgi:hypothetical protein
VPEKVSKKKNILTTKAFCYLKNKIYREGGIETC